jgi:hypothetical protein
MFFSSFAIAIYGPCPVRSFFTVGLHLMTHILDGEGEGGILGLMHESSGSMKVTTHDEYYLEMKWPTIFLYTYAPQSLLMLLSPSLPSWRKVTVVVPH